MPSEPKKVESSHIESVNYDPAGHELFIRFKNGSHYRYSGVTPEVHSEFMKAPSKGKFFHEKIREHYDQSRITESAE